MTLNAAGGLLRRGENIQWDIVRPWWIWKMCDIYILHFRAKTWHSQSTVRPSWKFDRWKSTGKTRWHLETWEQHPGWSGWRGMTWRLPATDLRSRYRCLTCFKSKPRQLWRHLRAVWDGGFHRKNRDAPIAGWLIYVDYCWFKCWIFLWNQMNENWGGRRGRPMTMETSVWKC